MEGMIQLLRRSYDGYPHLVKELQYYISILRSGDGQAQIKALKEILKGCNKCHYGDALTVFCDLYRAQMVRLVSVCQKLTRK